MSQRSQVERPKIKHPLYGQWLLNRDARGIHGGREEKNHLDKCCWDDWKPTYETKTLARLLHQRFKIHSITHPKPQNSEESIEGTPRDDGSIQAAEMQQQKWTRSKNKQKDTTRSKWKYFLLQGHCQESGKASASQENRVAGHISVRSGLYPECIKNYWNSNSNVKILK